MRTSALKSRIAVIALLAACFGGMVSAGQPTHFADATTVRGDAIASAFKEKRSDVSVTGVGVVERILPDDNDGKRHQRFILTLASGQTLLVAHNIDLAPRLAPLSVGDRVEFAGTYEWNAKGGAIHRTHRDPSGKRGAGWLKSNAQFSQ